MIGITSYGGYIPRLRLSRKSILQHVGWLLPGLAAMAQGERSICNWDEDSVTMAVAAARDCLIGTHKPSVDGLYLASTTLPFADRLNAGIIATALNLRHDIVSADFTSSLGASTSALLAGLATIKSGERKSLLVVASDKREAKAASNNEMLCGDGAASLLLGDQDVVAEFCGSYSVSYDFVDHYRGAQHQFDYNWEERWLREEGYARIIPEAIRGLLSKLGLSIDEIDKLVYPCIIRREHLGIARALGAGPGKVVDNLHEVCGETGTAHPLVMLVAALEQAKPGERIVVAGFGQGSDALLFQITDHVHKIAPRKGIAGALANKKSTDDYMKYLKFRDLILTETGIRAESPSQTALTSLWRNRKMIEGLVGGRCLKCGTAQFPKERFCVNPDCGAFDQYEDYEFADVPAMVKSFTADTLAISMDPPAIYGIVQFEGGGRFLADFTDCELDDVKVGLPVKMSFRKHASDKGRGFTGYFWKAVPEMSRAQAKT
ncbi:MAG: hydroxymethylglutaryl-CoA synthase family protein [Chloroflexota bacterium]|nr:MAG: hydroxymethylglutaryl-CoA synthase family protein [Chloroflexota bacterium]